MKKLKLPRVRIPAPTRAHKVMKRQPWRKRKHKGSDACNP